MFWNDVKEVLLKVSLMEERFTRTEERIQIIYEILDELKEEFNSEDEYSCLNRIHDKIDEIAKGDNQLRKAESALKVCDKFEDYMKNIDKLNSMINEFKGLVSRVRGEFNKKN